MSLFEKMDAVMKNQEAHAFASRLLKNGLSFTLATELAFEQFCK